MPWELVALPQRPLVGTSVPRRREIFKSQTRTVSGPARSRAATSNASTYGHTTLACASCKKSEKIPLSTGVKSRKLQIVLSRRRARFWTQLPRDPVASLLVSIIACLSSRGLRRRCPTIVDEKHVTAITRTGRTTSRRPRATLFRSPIRFAPSHACRDAVTGTPQVRLELLVASRTSPVEAENIMVAGDNSPDEKDARTKRGDRTEEGTRRVQLRSSDRERESEGEKRRSLAVGSLP